MTGAPLLALAGGGVEADDDGGPADLPEDDPAEDTGDGTAPVAAPDDPGEAPPPTDYEYVLGSGGDHGVDGFRPGTDTLTLTSETWDFELYDLGGDGDCAALEIVLGEMRSILRFPGLDMLPVDDVYLHVAEAGKAGGGSASTGETGGWPRGFAPLMLPFDHRRGQTPMPPTRRLCPPIRAMSWRRPIPTHRRRDAPDAQVQGSGATPYPM